MADEGRAGIPVQWSATPSSGGLQAIHVIALSNNLDAPRLYDPLTHSWLHLKVDVGDVQRRNDSINSSLGVGIGTTLRFIGDSEKISAAYINGESLIFRDAGCLLATIGLCAEWLGLSACSQGVQGQDMLPALGFPVPRFRGAGGVHVTCRGARKGHDADL